MQERRKSQRISSEGDYYCLPENIKVKIRCNLKNISITGACIDTAKILKKDDIVFLHIGRTGNLYLKSKVVWKIEDSYGLLFFLETSQDFTTISYLINNEMRRINLM
jgi:hypothetical protein